MIFCWKALGEIFQYISYPNRHGHHALDRDIGQQGKKVVRTSNTPVQQESHGITAVHLFCTRYMTNLSLPTSFECRRALLSISKPYVRSRADRPTTFVLYTQTAKKYFMCRESGIGRGLSCFVCLLPGISRQTHVKYSPAPYVTTHRPRRQISFMFCLLLFFAPPVAVRQSAKHSPTYYEPDEKFSLFATPGVRPRKWQTVSSLVFGCC